MKKTIIFSVAFFGVLIGLFIITNVKDDNKSFDSKEIIRDHIKEEGFSFDENSDCYKKSITNNTLTDYYQLIDEKKKASYEELYFYLNQQRLNLESEKYENVYYLNKLKMEYENDIYRNYSSDYNLVDKMITYKYDVTMFSSTLIVSGTYDEENNKFTCEIASNKGMDEASKDVFCTRAEYETNLFLQQIKDLLDNQDFVDAIYQK